MNAKSGFITQLEGIRGVAILLVLMSHFGLGAQLAVIADNFPWRGVGVRTFFVISGFLITGMMLKAQAKIIDNKSTVWESFSSFFVRKSIRLYPVYFFALGLVLLFDFDNFSDVWAWHALFVSNFDAVRFADIGSDSGLRYAPTAHLWSLSLQEQFYLLFPFVVFLIRGKPLVITVTALALVAPLWRCYWLYIGDPTYPHQNLFVLPANLDTLMAGSLLAMYKHRYAGSDRVPTWFIKSAVIASITFMGIFAAFFYAGVGQRITLALFDLPFAICICYLLFNASLNKQNLPGRLFDLTFLRFVGKISYSVYLYHAFTPHILRYLANYFGFTPDYGSTAWAIGLFGGSLLMGYLSWRLLEVPIIHYRNQRSKKTSGEVGQAPAIQNS